MLNPLGVRSVAKSGSAKLKGDVTLSEGSNVTLTQSGNNIEIAASGSGGAPTDAQYVTLATNVTLTQERVLTGTANQITITDNGAGSTVVLSTPQDLDTAAAVQFGTITVGNTGLHVLDTDASHDLILKPGSNLTVDRTLTLTTGDADRTLTISGDTTLSGGTHSGTNTGDQTITLTGDVTGSGTGSFAATIASNAVTYAKMQDVSATSRVLGRKTAGAGDTEECTLSEVLDFIGSAAQGDILYRGASSWARLGAGTSGQVLQTFGAGANPQWVTLSSGTPRGYISGLTLSNDTDTDHDISISAGVARDSTNTYDLTRSSAIVKQIDAAWAVGTAAGGLFSGTVGNNTWYHVFLIRKDSDGTIDAGFDTSVTAANIPAGYTAYRRIGSVYTDGSANIRQFTQFANQFLWKSPIEDVDNETNPGTTASLKTLSVPPDVRVFALVQCQHTEPANNITLYLSSPDVNDDAVSTNGTPLGCSQNPVGYRGYYRGYVRTNTSKQIRRRFHFSTASLAFDLVTCGWLDARGAD